MSHEQNQSCIEACKTCAEMCDSCVAASRYDPNPQMMSRCNALCMDCAAMCRLAASYLSRDSEFIDLICQDCAEVCSTCAEECLKHPMSHCRDCAIACNECAEECLKMGTTPLQPSSLRDGVVAMGASM